MSKVVPTDVNCVFVSIILSKHAERDFVLDYTYNNPDSSGDDAQEILQHHKKDDGTFLPSLLAVKFIAGRRKSKKHTPGGLLSQATTVVTIK